MNARLQHLGQIIGAAEDLIQLCIALRRKGEIDAERDAEIEAKGAEIAQLTRMDK